MLVLESSRIKLSPNLIAFINQAVHSYLKIKQMEVKNITKPRQVATSLYIYICTLFAYCIHLLQTEGSPLDKLQPYCMLFHMYSLHWHATVTGSRTVIIQINKTIVELTCAPTTEVACKLELGPLELFISSILKKTKANSTVLLNNASLNLSIILFKVCIPATTIIDMCM